SSQMLPGGDSPGIKGRPDRTLRYRPVIASTSTVRTMPTATPRAVRTVGSDASELFDGSTTCSPYQWGAGPADELVLWPAGAAAIPTRLGPSLSAQKPRLSTRPDCAIHFRSHFPLVLGRCFKPISGRLDQL